MGKAEGTWEQKTAECPALLLDGLFCRIRAFSLRDISLSLQQGYILGLVGRNGAGKSTLLRSIVHPENCRKGNLFVGGVDARREPVKARGLLGLLSEEQPFEWAWTVTENAENFGKFYHNFSMERFRELAVRFELPGRTTYAELSAGMRMKFQLAFALAHFPRLLLMDEATGTLDVVFRREFFYLLQEAVERDLLSVVIATHVTEDLDKVADYVACLDDGRLCLCCSKEELYDWERQRLIAGGVPEGQLKEQGAARLEDILYHYGRERRDAPERRSR